MSDGISLFSPCCNDSLATQKEYDYLKIKISYSKQSDNNRLYDSRIPVYTCIKCKKQWAMERVYE